MEPLITHVNEAFSFDAGGEIVQIAASEKLDVILVAANMPNGKGMVYCLNGSGALLWSQEFTVSITALSISPNGSYIAVCTSDLNIYYLNRQGQPLWKNPLKSRARVCVSSDDGRYTAVGLEDGNVNFFDNSMVARAFAWKYGFEGPVNALGIDGAGRVVLGGSEAGELTLLTDTGVTVWTKTVEGGVASVAVASEGDFAVIGGRDLRLYYRSVETGQALWTHETEGVVVDVSITPRGRLACCASKDGRVYLFTEKGKVLWERCMDAPPQYAKLSRNGMYVAASSIDGTIELYHLDGTPIWRTTLREIPRGLFLHATGEGVVAAAGSRLVYLSTQKALRDMFAVYAKRYKGTPEWEGAYREAWDALNAQEYNEVVKAVYGVVNKGTGDDRMHEVEAKIEELKESVESARTVGIKVEPAENLLKEAIALAAEGKFDEAMEFARDAEELLVEMMKQMSKAVSKEAVDAIQKATEMLDSLKMAEAESEAVEKIVREAEDALGSGDGAKATELANQAIAEANRVMDAMISRVLVQVKELMIKGEEEGKDTTEAKKMLVGISQAMEERDFVRALEDAKRCLELMEELFREEPAPLRPPTIPPPPSVALSEEPAPAPEKEQAPEPAQPAPAAPREGIPLTLSASKEMFSSIKATMDSFMEKVAAMQYFDATFTETVSMLMQMRSGITDAAIQMVSEALVSAEEVVRSKREAGFPLEEAEDLMAQVKSELEAENVVAAAELLSNIPRAIKDAERKALMQELEALKNSVNIAQQMGAEISELQAVVSQAEKAVEEGSPEAVNLIKLGHEKAKEAARHLVEKMKEEAENLLRMAAEYGADVTQLREELAGVDALVNEGKLTEAKELIAQVSSRAQELPGKVLTERINQVRARASAIEKMGIDILLVKNLLIQARSALVSKNYEAVKTHIERAADELDRAPANALEKRINELMTQLEGERAMGEDVSGLEAMLSEAHGLLQNKDFENAHMKIEECRNQLQELKQRSAGLVNALYEADEAISRASEAGKDVSEASQKLMEAMQLRSTDPARALELAEEVKRLCQE